MPRSTKRVTGEKLMPMSRAEMFLWILPVILFGIYGFFTPERVPTQPCMPRQPQPQEWPFVVGIVVFCFMIFVCFKLSEAAYVAKTAKVTQG